MRNPGLFMLLVLLWGPSSIPDVYAKDPADADIEAAMGQIIGAAGFGERDPQAPEEVDQFGRLVGVWLVDQEIRMRDLSWLKEPAGIWVWKYAVGGYGVQDVWYQSKDRLPRYMGNLGHDYLLTAIRVYDPTSDSWRVAWASNAANGGPGAVFGTFTARFEDGEIVMRGPGATANLEQRIVFHAFTHDSFKWRSEFSQDGGATWMANMRLTARRIR